MGLASLRSLSVSLPHITSSSEQGRCLAWYTLALSFSALKIDMYVL